MANEIRSRSAGVAGTLSAALNVGGTIMSSAKLANLPVIDTTNHALVTIYNDSGDYETLRVTAHAAAATNATVEALYGARPGVGWAVGAKWRHGPSLDDFELEVADAVALAALPAGSLYSGRKVAVRDTGEVFTRRQMASGVGAWLPPPTGRRNVIRNGDMGVAQRGNGAFTTDAYSMDGFFTASGGAATHSVSRVATTPGETGAPFWLAFTTAASAAAGDITYTTQKIEGVRTLAGKEVTLSFVAKAGAGTPKIGVEIAQNFGTGGSPSAQVLTAISAVTISTTATRYTVTFTIPSISGKTLGTAGDDNLELWLWLSAGTTFASRASSIGHQNATISITDVQLEQGSGSPFERLPQQEQLAWCQRYFYAIGNLNAPDTGSTTAFLGNGFASSGTTGQIAVPFPVPLRAAPTFSMGTAGTVSLSDGVTAVNSNSTAIYAGNSSSRVALINVSVASGLTQFRPYRWEVLNGQTNQAQFSAEL